MKKICLFNIVAILGCFSAFAQVSPNQVNPKPITLQYRSQNVYLEVLGPGLTYSVNYDSRFFNRPDGLGARIGVGYYHQSGDRFFTAPVMVNYLLGKHDKFLELGAGITIYNTNTNYPFLNNHGHDDKHGVLGNFIFGYRVQPEDQGFGFRIGLSPILTSKTFAPYWPYASFGYSF